MLGLAALVEEPACKGQHGCQQADDHDPAQEGREHFMGIGLCRKGIAVHAGIEFVGDHGSQIDQAADRAHEADRLQCRLHIEGNLVADHADHRSYGAGDQAIEEQRGVQALKEGAAADRDEHAQCIIEHHQCKEACRSVGIDGTKLRHIRGSLRGDEHAADEQDDPAEDACGDIRHGIHGQTAEEIREVSLCSRQRERIEHIDIGLFPELREGIDRGEHSHEHRNTQAHGADAGIGLHADIDMPVFKHEAADQREHDQRNAENLQNAGDDVHFPVLPDDAQTVAERKRLRRIRCCHNRVPPVHK